jgi:hypothetical protein
MKTEICGSIFCVSSQDSLGPDEAVNVEYAQRSTMGLLLTEDQWANPLRCIPSVQTTADLLLLCCAVLKQIIQLTIHCDPFVCGNLLLLCTLSEGPIGSTSSAMMDLHFLIVEGPGSYSCRV